MPGTSHSSRSALGTAERSTRRVLVSPPIYVDLDKVNGGLVFNISEDGMAISAAKPLGRNGPLAMRIQLPDADGCVEATGQIVWISESRKSAGLKFVSLPEDVRQRIRDWIASENSNDELLPEPELLPETAHFPTNETPAIVPMRALSLTADSNIVEERHTPEPALTSSPPPLIDQPQEAVAQGLPQPVESSTGSKSSPRLTERRSHPRCEIEALSYIRLGRENGGILLNISEGGFAVRAASNVSEGDVATIRIQYTESWECVEVSGEIAWTNESTNRAGIRFVSLTKDARAKIVNWLSLDPLPGEFEEQSAEIWDDPLCPDAMPEIAKSTVSASGGLPPGSLPQEPQRAVPVTGADEAPAPALAFGSLPLGLFKQSDTKPKSRFSFFPRSFGTGAARLSHIVAAVILADIMALGIVWVAAPSGFRHAVVEFVTQNGASARTPILAKKPLSSSQSTKDSAVQSENISSQGNLPESAPASEVPTRPQVRLAPVTPQVVNGVHSTKTPAPKDTLGQSENPLTTGRPSKVPDRSFFAMPNPQVEGTRAPIGENSHSLPAESTTPSSVPPGSVLGSLVGPELKRSEIPPPPKVPDPPVVPPRPVVTVSTDPYPAIRFLPRAKSKKLTDEGKALQIGHLVSRAEPVYPQDAQREGLEGTVKLHIVVSRDGTVAKLDPVSGPPPLLKAAINAVREWRYTQTLLGGQPVETEQDVIVNFRLLSPSTSAN